MNAGRGQNPVLELSLNWLHKTVFFALSGPFLVRAMQLRRPAGKIRAHREVPEETCVIHHV
jgi:hypothetical protein